MKAFIVSVSIIFVIFAFTIINSIYIDHVTEDLIGHARALSMDVDSVEAFSSLWEKKQFSLRLSSSHEETHKIDEVLAVIRSKVTTKDEVGFCDQRALLVEYLIQIHDDEDISLDSII